MTRVGWKQPNKDSLSDELKSNLNDRYIEASYKWEILPWLKDYLLPNCKRKDMVYEAGLIQYVDFLEGLFGIRKKDKKVNEKMKKYLEDKLLKDKDILSNIELLDKEIINLNDMINSINQLKEDKVDEVLQDFMKSIYDKINIDNEWECVIEVDKKSSFGKKLKNNFGFSWNKNKIKHTQIINDKKEIAEYFISIELQDRQRLLLGVYVNKNQEFKENLLKNLHAASTSEESRHYKILGKHKNWVILKYKNLDYNNHRIAENMRSVESLKYLLDKKSREEILQLISENVNKLIANLGTVEQEDTRFEWVQK